MRFCIYCASSALAPEHYSSSAFELGQLLAQANITVVYGGGGVGSMGRLADGVLSKNGQIIGVMPKFMKDLEWGHSKVADFTWTNDLAERKAKLLEHADAVIALPGGCGTFEELMEVITLKRLGIFVKPVIIVNQNGYYDPLIALFERSVQDRFMDARHLTMYSVVSNVSEVIDAVRNAVPWDANARDFAAMR
ncbi:MAG: TIGR00730 family Rossman fold protein [Bacteroidota bacterium]